MSDYSLPAARVPEAIRDLIEEFEPRLRAISEPAFAEKKAPDRWSRKEVIGHLIDSAQNNLRRFITAQYESKPPHIVYDQDFWVVVNAYQKMASAELITLWKLLNIQVATVLENLSVSDLEKTCNTGKGEDQWLPLHFIAIDYFRHLRHHLDQVFS